VGIGQHPGNRSSMLGYFKQKRVTKRVFGNLAKKTAVFQAVLEVAENDK
jgi:hypothetical protein